MVGNSGKFAETPKKKIYICVFEKKIVGKKPQKVGNFRKMVGNSKTTFAKNNKKCEKFYF